MPFLHNFFPVPSYNAYMGPYPVGTQDFEVPVSELSSASQSPPDSSISTVSFRIFYPCIEEPKKQRNTVYWLPEPQNEYFQAYARFLRASPWLASLLSYIPLVRPLFHTTIPAHSSASILSPVANVPSSRWPVAFFSHGLGGTKNAYSSLLGSLASHGLVTIALDHRDGSAPISFIRAKSGTVKGAKRVEYRQIGHRSGKEVDEKRDQQLRIRCWEMAAAYEVICKLDRGESLNNLVDDKMDDHHHRHKNLNANRTNIENSANIFTSKLDVHQPGRIAWAGHSFGAATIVQFVKSIAYFKDVDSTSLLLSNPSSDLLAQITPATQTIFLDLWATPLHSASTRALFDRPLPCYPLNPDPITITNNATDQPTSSPPLAILSEAFFNWKDNLADTIRVVSPPLSPSPPPSLSQLNPHSSYPTPHIFYPLHSAHLSQSDFGPLFPWFTQRVFKAAEPARAILLNVRAILEVVRMAGVDVAGLTEGEREVELELATAGERRVVGQVVGGSGGGGGVDVGDDMILDVGANGKGGLVRGWIAIPIHSAGEGRRENEQVALKESEAVEQEVKAVEKYRASPDSGYDSPGPLAGEVLGNARAGEAGA